MARWESASFADRDQLPRAGGIYALYRKDELVYIGRAGNIRARMTGHIRKRVDSVKFRYLGCPRAQRLAESRLIYRLRPRLNKAVYVRSAWTYSQYGW